MAWKRGRCKFFSILLLFRAIKNIFFKTKVIKLICAYFQFLKVYRKEEHQKERYGAILINKERTHVLLVQGYEAQQDNWGLPKGKLEEGDSKLECAVKEVYEETGYDIAKNVQKDVFFNVKKTNTTYYVVPDVEMDFPFAPKVKKEIKKIMWYPLNCLPDHYKDEEGTAKFNMTPRNFAIFQNITKDIKNLMNPEALGSSQDLKVVYKLEMEQKIVRLPSKMARFTPMPMKTSPMQARTKPAPLHSFRPSWMQTSKAA